MVSGQTARHSTALNLLEMAKVVAYMRVAKSGSADLLLMQTRFYFEYATFSL